jgi:hypothetical protein
MKGKAFEIFYLKRALKRQFYINDEMVNIF